MPFTARAFAKRRRHAGISLIGMIFWAFLISVLGLIAMKVFPALNEYATIDRAVRKIAREGITTVPEIRMAFEKQKQIEYSISSISSKDLEITKDGDKVIISYAYDAQILLIEPVYLLIKFSGSTR